MNERDTHIERGPSRLVQALPAAAAGLAAFAVVLDEVDAPHDNLQGVSTLALGAVVGLVLGLAVQRGAPGERARPSREIAWDIVRLVLAFEMVRYGIGKMLGAQFYPQYWRLEVAPAKLEPRSLAWLFLGRNYGYQAFGGIVELTGAVLLCFRRTTLLGACVLLTAMGNVVLINVFYDVPVKLFSATYLLLNLALIARDAPRLRSVLLPRLVPSRRSRGARWAYGALVALVLLAPAAEITQQAIRHRVFTLDPLEGAWAVDQREGLAELLSESPGPLDRIYLEKGGFGSMRIGVTLVQLKYSYDPDARALRLSDLNGNQARTYEGSVTLLGPRVVYFRGGGGAVPSFAMRLSRLYP